MSPRVRHYALVAVFALTATPLTRAENATWPVARGPARAAAPYRYDPAALKALPTEFLDDAAACILFSGTVSRLEADGTVETTTQEVIRLNGRKGIDEFGEYHTITYAPAYEAVTLHEARVYKASGGVLPVAPLHVRLRDVNTDHQIYESSKQVVISFPGLEVGDVIEIHWTTRGRHPEYQNAFFYRYTFGHEKYPVARDEWTARVPKDRPFRYASVNGPLEPKIAEDGGERVYHWSATNCKAPPQGDHLPPREELQQQVVASTFASWDEVHRWERNLVADRSRCTPEIKAVIDEATRGLTDPLSKARALTQWVRRQIRYVSAGEKHDFTPRAPGLTVAYRYGDCKDTAHLLAVMLREVGIPAGSVTLGSRGDGQIVESVPSPWGTHAIVRVTIDGREHWIDTTAHQLGWDVLPNDDCDRVCYVTDESGIRVTRTPRPDPDRHATELTTHVTARTDGSIRAERTARYDGLAAWSKRDNYVDTPSAERRRLAAADLVESYTKARLRDLTLDGDLNDFDKPLTVKLSFEVPDHFAGDKTREGNLGDVNLWGPLLSVTLNPERTAALDLGDPFTAVCRYVVHLPPAFRYESVPANQRVNSAWGSFRLEARQNPDDPRQMELEFRARLAKTRVEPAEFEAFQQFLDAVQGAYRVSLKLQPTADAADIPLLEKAVKATPGDTVTAAALAELYIAREKLDDARRVLEQARGANPGERKLWELSLAAAADPEAELQLFEQMIERFPDEPHYRIDLGQILIEQGRPGDARKVLEPLAKHKDAAVRGPALLALAHCHLAQEEPKQALRLWKDAEKAHPEGLDAEAWALAGEIHTALDERAEAIAAYRKALGQEPEATAVLDALVRLLAESGAKDEALGYLRRLIVAAGNHPEALALAADGCARLGRFDDALELGQRAKGEDGRLVPLAHRPLGLALAQRGKLTEALEHLSKIDPDAATLAARIHARLALGKLADAEADADRAAGIEDLTPELKRAVAAVRALVERCAALRRQSDSPAVERFACAEYLAAQGQWPERGDALLTEALTADARFGPAYGLRAVRHLDRGRLVQALRDAEQAIQLSPEDYRGYSVRGRVRLERGTEGALADMTKAAELSGRKDAATLNALAAALAQAGRKDEALKAQREALKLRPEDPELREQLRELEARR